MKIILSLFILLFYSSIFSFVEKKDVKIGVDYDTIVREPEIFDRAEVSPKFPGGVVKLFDFLKKNMQYPEEAKSNGLEGKVIVKFYIDVDGSVREPVVLKDGVGGGASEEAIRLIKLMPKWLPGTQRGKPVKVYYTMPVLFQL